MVDSRQTIARLLAAFADALRAMDDNQFDLLIQGKAKLRLVEAQKSGKKALADFESNEAISELALRLKESDSREAAERLLASITHSRRKDVLLRLAEACGVRIASKDKITRIEQQLIENVVGTKLGSQAIKNLPF